jgi:hypothetical protein
MGLTGGAPPRLSTLSSFPEERAGSLFNSLLGSGGERRLSQTSLGSPGESEPFSKTISPGFGGDGRERGYPRRYDRASLDAQRPVWGAKSPRPPFSKGERGRRCPAADSTKGRVTHRSKRKSPATGCRSLPCASLHWHRALHSLPLWQRALNISPPLKKGAGGIFRGVLTIAAPFLSKGPQHLSPFEKGGRGDLTNGLHETASRSTKAERAARNGPPFEKGGWGDLTNGSHRRSGCPDSRSTTATTAWGWRS